MEPHQQELSPDALTPGYEPLTEDVWQYADQGDVPQRGVDNVYSPTAGFHSHHSTHFTKLQARGADNTARLRQYGQTDQWMGSDQRPAYRHSDVPQNNNDDGYHYWRYSAGAQLGRNDGNDQLAPAIEQVIRARLRRGLPNVNIDQFLIPEPDYDLDVTDSHEGKLLSTLTPESLQTPASKVTTLPPPQRRCISERLFAKETLTNLSHLLQAPTTKLEGYKKWKHERAKAWKQAKLQMREWFDMVEIWRGTFKDIEGHFGSAIVAYYRVIKWLLLMNIFIMVVILALIVLPQQLLQPASFISTLNASSHDARYLSQAQKCSQSYDVAIRNITSTEGIFSSILDFFQGKGWMEQTVLFAGYYFNKTYTYGDKQHSYNMPLAYLLATAAYFLVTLILMVLYTGQSGTERSLTGGRSKTLNSLCNQVFCAWDFSLSQEKAAKLKHLNLLQQYKNEAAVLRRKEEVCNRSVSRRAAIYTARIFVNMIVIVMCLGAFYLIYQVEQVWMTQLLNKDVVKNSSLLSLVAEYLPSITITILNVIIPAIFYKIVIIENLSPDMEVRITIARSVILRLTSVIVLVLSLRTQITCEEQQCGNCAPILCWETYVGQQFYKLVILDFLVVLFVTFCVEFPRKLIVTKFPNNWLIQLVGVEEFELPKNVLDIVYSQTISWIGGFFCPLIPAITVIKFLVYFYVKKLTLMKNCMPSSRPYRASRTNAFFMIILLISFVLCIIIIAYTIGRMLPSQSCSPFRIYSTDHYYMYRSVTDAVRVLGNGPKDFLLFIGSWLFYIPAGVLLCLVIYYNVALVSANKRMVAILKDQLALVGEDKRFLIRLVMAAMNERNRAVD